MDRLIFTANATIREQSVVRQALVNDLANVSTVGFKSSFDVALTSIKADGPGFDTRFQTQLKSRDLIRMTPGAIMVTGRALDIAMSGQTVLAVQPGNGDLAYTRRGDLKANPNGQLETGNGHLVLGQNGPITVPAGSKITITADGSIYAADPNQPGNAPGILVDRLRIQDASQTQFERREDGLFKVAGQPNGTALQAGPVTPELIPNSLEGSNVSGIEAMTRMMDHCAPSRCKSKSSKKPNRLTSQGPP